MNKLKALKKSDHVTLVFGEWLDKLPGNTYYDVEVMINETTHRVPYQYGYNAGSNQSIDEALASIGYRVRNSRDYHAPYRAIHTSTKDKLKRELFTQRTQ